MAKPIWRSFAPLKCKIFGWLALRYRLWTSDMRARHGLQEHSDPCATCLQEEDNIDHILSHYPYAKMVWFGCLRRLGSQLQEPQENTNLERWWTEARKRLRREDRRGFDTLVLLIAWTLWKQRNARVFGNLERQLFTEQIIDSVRSSAFGGLREEESGESCCESRFLGLGGVSGLATDRCLHPPLFSCNLFAPFYKDLARRSRAREKKL
jgi:hypothetical protein